MPSERIQRQIDSLLDEADAAIRQSNWTLVRERAEQVLTLDPDNPDGQFYLAAAERGVQRATAVAATTALPPVAAEVVSSTQVAAAPTSFAAGRYQVTRPLGQGATKKVYLARDTRLDREVALALIKTDALDEAGLARVRREAQAMARLGDHPNVVAVYDIGEEAGQPYIVSQLMAGGDVEGLLRQADDHRLPMEQALVLAEQVAAALEHAHRHGIVHRDLKPGNVWLTSEGIAKLGDFGLAVARDRSRLTADGMIVGTASYMAPEQALSEQATPQSDLYALGAMLYELVTGRPPFVADQTIAILTQLVNVPPVAPSWHRPDCPAALENLILNLLEKDSAKRPASATEVRRGLAELRASLSAPLPASPAATREGAAVGSNPLYRRAFVGREAELRQAQAAFDAALSGNGSLLMVVGEPGIGKTAFCEQLATYASVRGGRTLVGHCYEEGSLSLPYLAFVEAMRSYVLMRPPEALREELGIGAPEVARIVSEVRDRVGVELRPSSDTEEDRWRLLSAVTEFLRAAATAQPLVIVLEDLHWADRGTLDLLAHLARTLQGTRLLIVGTYRDVEVDRAHPLAAALADLRRTAPLQRVVLRGLTADEVQRMLSALATHDVSWGLAEAVYRQTEGNPLFIQEVLRYLVEEGLLARDEEQGGRQAAGSGQTSLALSIPEGLRDVIGRRLSRLSPECNQLLSIAAVIGRDFTLDTLLAVADQPESAVVAALEEAVRVAVLEDQSSAGAVRFRFSHAFIRQTLYEEIFTPRRIRLHQQVARALEKQYAARLEEHAAELAEHFAQSADTADLAKAVEYSERAAQRAMAVYAYSEAVRHLEQALQAQQLLDPDGKLKRCELLLALGEALMPAGEPQRAAEDIAEQIIALAESLDDEEWARRACRLAREALDRYGGQAFRRSPTYRKWAEHADRYAKPATVDRVYADLMLANIQIVSGNRNEGRALQHRALELARELGDPEAMFLAAEAVASSSGAPRTWGLRLPLAEEFSRRSRQGVRTRTVAVLLDSVAVNGYLQWGKRTRAEELFQEVQDFAARTRDPDLLLRSAFRKAMFARIDGKLEEALEQAEALVTMADELGSPVVGRAQARVVRAWALLYLGRGDEALAASPEPVGDLAALAAAQPVLAERALCLATMGRTAEAEALLLERFAFHGVGTEDDGAGANALVPLLDTAILVDNRDAAVVLSQTLDIIAGGIVPGNPTCIALHLGAAAVYLGDSVQARHYYEQAVEVCTEARFRPELSLAHLGLAELDAAQGQIAAAKDHLAFCVPEFEAMKMRPALEKALALKEALHAQ